MKNDLIKKRKSKLFVTASAIALLLLLLWTNVFAEESDGDYSTVSSGTKTIFNTEYDSGMITAANFTDVPGSAWYSDAVNFVAAMNVMKGIGPGIFAPDDRITRAQFVTILHQLSGNTLRYTASSFHDINTSDWFFNAVQWSYENGIAYGEDGKFAPQAFISRQDIAVMIERYAEQYKGYTFQKVGTESTFPDRKDIDPSAENAVNAMQQAGILSGRKNGSFDPEGNATRAETASMTAALIRIMVN